MLMSSKSSESSQFCSFVSLNALVDWRGRFVLQHVKLLVKKVTLTVLSIVQVTKEDKSFQNIMKCYRSQPQASSSVSVTSVCV